MYCVYLIYIYTCIMTNYLIKEMTSGGESSVCVINSHCKSHLELTSTIKATTEILPVLMPKVMQSVQIVVDT